MSAAVQELYAGLPIVLSAERSALSDPAIVLDVEPETPAFVLSCGSGLPTEHPRTYGLSIHSQDSYDRPDYVGQMPGPRLRELLSKEPAGTGVLAGNEKTQAGTSGERECFPGQLREDAGATESTRGVVEEGLGCSPQASKAACWSKEKEPRLIQEEREFLPRPTSAERAGLLQSLEENQASVQVAAENPPVPTHEAPGRKADGTVQFGKAGESTPRASAGVPPGSRESAGIGLALAEVAVLGASTLVPLEPVSAVDDALAQAPLRGEENRRGPGACTTSSATASLPSASEAGGVPLSRPGQGVGAALLHAPPSHQDKTDNRSASGLESKATLDPWLASTVPEMSNGPFQDRSELGPLLWEEDTTDVFELVCETQEESPLSEGRCLAGTAACENIELLEEWASQTSAGSGLCPAYCKEELSSNGDGEQETGSWADHSYSLACEGGVDVEAENAMQACREEARANPRPETGQPELQICPFAKAEKTHPKSNTSFLLEIGRSSAAGHSGKSIPLGSDGVQRDERPPLPKDGALASVQEGNAFPCSASPLPLLACHAPFSCVRKSCQEPLWQVESTSNQGTGMNSSAASLQADTVSSPVGSHLVSDEEKTPTAQSRDEPSVSRHGGILDSLPEEGSPRTCAELGRERTGSLQELSLAINDCGSCTDWSGEPQHCTALGLHEVRVAEMQAVESLACNPSDWHKSTLGSTSEAGCTPSRSICLGDHALKRRTETNTEPADGLEMCPAPVHTQTATPPPELSGTGPHNSTSYENIRGDLDRAGSNSGSLCSMWASSTRLLKAEALDIEVDSRRVEGDSCVSAEELLETDTRDGPPDTCLERGQIVASSPAGPGGTETVDSEKVEEDGHRNGANEKPRGDGWAGNTVYPLELDRRAKDQAKEEPARFHVPPSSPASDLSRLKTALKASPPAPEQGCPLYLEDVCTEDPPGQQRPAGGQEEGQAPVRHHDHLNSPVSWHWESATPDKEALEGQQDPSVTSGRQEGGGAVQAVTNSAKEAPRSSSSSQCLKSDGTATLPASAPEMQNVMQNDVQQAFPQNISGHCFSDEMESESVDSTLKQEPVESKSPGPASECLESAFEQLPLNVPAKEWADQVKAAGFCPASRSAQTSPSDVQDESRSVTFSQEFSLPSKQDCSHPAPNPLAVANGQTRTEGVDSSFCQGKELPSSTRLTQPAQHPGTTFSQKNGPSPSPNVLCRPPALEYPALTVPLDREGDGPISSTLENDRDSHPPQEGACGVSPPCSKETPRSTMGSMAGAAALRESGCPAPSRGDASRKIEPSLGDQPREGSQAPEKMDLPVGSSSPSGPFSQGSRPIAREEEVPVPFKAKAGTRLPPDSSEPDQSEEPACVKAPSKTAGRKWRPEDIPGHPRQSEDLLPTRSAPGVLHNTVLRALLGGAASQASPKCFGNPESPESSLELSGVKWTSPAHTVHKDGEAPAVESQRVPAVEECPEPVTKALRKELGGCPGLSCDGLRAKDKLAAERSWKRRLLRVRVGPPLGLSFRGVKLDVPTPQAFPPGCGAECSRNKSAWIALQELKRPNISKDVVGLEHTDFQAGRTSLSVEDCGPTATESCATLAPVSPRCPPIAGCGRVGIQSASGSARRTQPALPFSRLPGKAWGEASGPGRSSAPSPARLKNPLEVVPRHRSQLEDCVCPAVQEGAVRKARTLQWIRAPKQRASPSCLLGPSGLGQLAKDQALLRRLSALADNLLAPPRNPPQRTPPWHSTQLLPTTGRCPSLPSQKLLHVFSGVEVKFNSWWTNHLRCGPVLSSAPSLALYPLDSVGLCVLGLDLKAPLSFRATPFPVSFHIKVGSFPARSLLETPSLQGDPHHVVLGGRDGAGKPSRWTLTFLFSRSCLGIAPVGEGAWTPAKSEKDRGEDAVALKRPGWPPPGLQTVLALSSPKCYRLCTRKQTLARHTPAGQKLTVLQLLQDLKVLKCSSEDLFSSVPHSLRRGLSLWSQRSPSSRPSEFPPLHSGHCKWQPVPPATTSLGLRSSLATWPQVPDWIVGPPWVAAGAGRLEPPSPPFPAFFPPPSSAPKPSLSALGLPAPGFPALPLDELDVSAPALPKTGTCLEKADSEKRPKKVSQIRIRKTIPKPDPNLTPMGLPRPKRLKKKEFSLEEIYTNKNYKSPPATRCLETIFEEPKERNGSLISVSQQKRKRILEFQDFTVPRKRRLRSRVKMLGSSTRAQKAALEGRELDVLLIQRLTDLEAFFAEEEKEPVVGS